MKNKQILIGLSLLFFTNVHPGKDTSEILMEQAAGALFNGIATIVTTQANDGLDRRKDPTPKEQAEIELITKNQALADKQIEFQEKHMLSLDKQMEEHKLDKTSKQFDLLQKESTLPGKQKSKDTAIKMKQIEKAIRNVTSDLPELTAEELKEIDDKFAPKSKKPEGDKKGLLSKLATPFVFALTTAGNAADVVAGYSVVHVTNLECFKDTFVQTQNFNRAVVFTALAAVTYGSYKLYKSQYADEDDDNILDLD